MLDACVLIPPTLRDTLLRLGERGLCLPKWTSTILDEFERHTARWHAEKGYLPIADSSAYAAALREQMTDFFDGAAIAGYESLVTKMTNHPKDRHVLAAAVRGDADVILTSNVRDFPAPSVVPHDIEVMTPGEFLGELLTGDPRAVLDELLAQAAENRNPPKTIPALLDPLDNITDVAPFPDRAAAQLGITRSLD